MKNRAVIVSVAGLMVTGIGVFFLGNIFSCGGSSLTESSKSLECGGDIQQALYAFQREMDMPFKIEEDDYRLIFDTGKIEKEYFRDGIKISASFNLTNSDGVCELKFYKRGRSEPGHYTSTHGNYGTVSLKKCACK